MSVKVLSAFLLIIAAANAQFKLSVVVNHAVDQPLYEGKDAVFECAYTVEGGDELQEVVWRFDGNKMFKISFDSGVYDKTRRYVDAPEDRFSSETLDGKSQMTIKNLMFKDEGKLITCDVETAKANNVSNRLEVRVDAKPESPVISADADLSKLTEGDVVELTCIGIVGRPYNEKDAVTWTYVDEQDMERPVPGALLSMETLQDNRGKATSTYRFNASASDNNARYRCTLKNAIGDQQSMDSSTLKVQDLSPKNDTPVTKLSEDKIIVTVKQGGTQKQTTTFKAGERVEMTCNIDVFPEPTIEWWFRKTDNAKNPNAMGVGKTYTINKVALNQAGVYECKAEQNNNGKYITASKSVTIKVIKPAPVVDPDSGKNSGRVLAASIAMLTAALLNTL